MPIFMTASTTHFGPYSCPRQVVPGVGLGRRRNAADEGGAVIELDGDDTAVAIGSACGEGDG